MKKALLIILAICCLMPAAPMARSVQARNDVTIYRDEFGIPHVFSSSLENAAFGVGYAQAEDRLEELLKNYRRAAGTMSEVFGPEHYRSDLIQRMWRHREVSREKYSQVSPRMRAVIESFQEGIKQYMKDHPGRCRRGRRRFSRGTRSLARDT